MVSALIQPSFYGVPEPSLKPIDTFLTLSLYNILDIHIHSEGSQFQIKYTFYFIMPNAGYYVRDYWNEILSVNQISFLFFSLNFLSILDRNFFSIFI